MAEPLDALERMVKAAKSAEDSGLLMEIRQALLDLLAATESKPAPSFDLSPLVAAVANVRFPEFPAMPQPDTWTSLQISAPVDTMGRPTGQMTITKIR